jgi:5-methylcytosine-specific restriction protein A
MTERRTLSASKRLAIFLKAEGCCHICKQKIHPGQLWEVEHPIPIAMGGADDETNMAPAHVKCHASKTADDLGKVAKCKRLQIRHAGIKKLRSFRRPAGARFDWALGRYTIQKEPAQ